MEELEMKVRKAVKETFNIEIPDNYWVYSMSEADYEGVLDGDPKKTREYVRSGKFSGVYIVDTDSGDRGLLDAVNGVYIKPFDMIGIKLNEKYVMLDYCCIKREDGTEDVFSYNLYNPETGKLSIDFSTTNELSKQGRQLSEELFEPDNAYGGIGQQARGSGFQTISVNEKMGLISEDTLTSYIEPQYDALMLAWGDVEELCNQITKKDQIYCVVKNDGKFGVVDLSNKVILPLDCGSFDELESYCKEQIAQVGV